MRCDKSINMGRKTTKSGKIRLTEVAKLAGVSPITASRFFRNPEALSLSKRERVDPRLVQAKLSRDACAVELRLAVIAPDFADPDAVQARLGEPENFVSHDLSNRKAIVHFCALHIARL